MFGFTNTPFLTANQGILYTPGAGQNFFQLDDPDLVSLFNQLATEFDPQKKIDLGNQIDQKLWDDVASLPLFQLPDILSYKKTIKNVVYNGPQGPTWNAFDWSLS